MVRASDAGVGVPEQLANGEEIHTSPREMRGLNDRESAVRARSLKTGTGGCTRTDG